MAYDYKYIKNKYITFEITNATYNRIDIQTMIAYL